MSRKYIKKAIREKIVALADWKCDPDSYRDCKSPRTFATESFTFDHIHPVAKGGETTYKNLAYSCSGCNSYKSDKIQIFDKTEKKWISLFNPRTQKWTKHFSWSDDFLEIIGISPTGRVTVNCLKVNRSSVQNLRSVLVLVGKHPPKVSK